MFSGRIHRFLHKIHIRQGLAFTLMFAVGTTIAFLWVFSSLYRSIMNDARETATSILLAHWALYRDEGRTSLIREIRTDRETEALILLTDQENQPLASHIPGNLFRELLPQLRDYPYPETGLFSIRDPDGKKMMFLTRALKISDDLNLRVIINLDRSLATFRKMQQRFFEVILVLLLTSFVAGTFNTIGALRPINLLNRELSALSVTADIRRRLPLRDTEDQLDSLIDHINQFLARIESLVTGMRQALDNTAHDLRTPLTRMKARAETVLLKDSPRPEELREALVGCLEESEIIIRMINSLMDIAEAEQGVLRLNRQEIDITLALKEIKDLYDFVAEERGIEVLFEVSTGEHRLYADPVRFRQILGNLIDNALKYSPAGSTVVLRSWSESGFQRFSLSDKGPGIRHEDLPHLWDRLYRGESSRTTRGLGLGLSVVKALTEAHGGYATAANNPAGGACFTISLPLDNS